jgi:hypothetical protein
MKLSNVLPEALPEQAEIVASQGSSLPVPAPRADELSRKGAVRPGLRWDSGFVFLLFVLAFFLASFPVRRSDFWLHLGTGKALLTGQAEFGTEPFTQTPPTAITPLASPGEGFWVNHSWLFDALLYVLYPEVVGGAGLVLVKALLVVGLAASMVCAACVGRSLWVAAAATALSLCALGPWLDIAPLLSSIVLLSLTVGFFEKGPWAAGTDALPVRSQWRRFVPILVVAVLWVNLDQWFILGPLVAAIYLAAALVPKSASGRAESGPADRTGAATITSSPLLYGVLLATVLAVSLINPHHVLVFPSALRAATLTDPGPLQEDPVVHGHLLGPVTQSGFRSSPARLAYWCLAILGVLSFVLNRERWRWPRAFLWLFFFFLAVYQSQAIPFFAVVGGVILALNMGEFLSANADRPGLMQSLRRGIPAWQLVGTLSLLTLVAASWTGALQARPYGPCSWRVEEEPSVREAARQMSRWRNQGKLGNHNGFVFSPELANYLAWLDPLEKGMVNSHGHGTVENSEDNALLREALLGRPTPQGRDWRAVMRQRDIDHVVLYSNDQRRVEAAVFHLSADSREWVPLFWQGRTVIFGWQDPAQPQKRFTETSLRPAASAFSFKDPMTAPQVWPGRDPQPYFWWHAFYKTQDHRSTDVDEAGLALTFFDARSPHQVTALVRAWNYCAYAGHVGLAGSLGGPQDALARLGSSKLWQLFLDNRDLGPRSTLYLAIRAARRALQTNPDNPFAHLILGEAYHRLWSATREKSWTKHYRSFGKMRTAQMIASYKHALQLKPDLELAHFRLAKLYGLLEFKDFALQHYQEYVKLAGAREPRAGESATLTQAKKVIAWHEQEIQRLRQQYDINSQNLKVADRAKLAGELGLPALALDILLKDDVSAFGTAGMDTELKLFLLAGETEKVRLWMDEEKEKVLPAYHWNKVQLCAAIGDYLEADRHLRAMVIMPPLGDKNKLALRSAAALILGQGLLDFREELFFRNPDWLLSALRDPCPMPHGLDGLFPGREGVRRQVMVVAEGLDQEADLAVLRGLLALESGRTAEAAARFQEALQFWHSATGQFFVGPESQWGRRIARQSLEMLDQVNSQAPMPPLRFP